MNEEERNHRPIMDSREVDHSEEILFVFVFGVFSLKNHL